MRSFGLLAVSLATVQAAGTVTLYSGTGCTGEFYSRNNPVCQHMEIQESADPSFDAKSMKFADVPYGQNIYVFTDINAQCQTPSGTASWEFWQSYGKTECHE